MLPRRYYRRNLNYVERFRITRGDVLSGIANDPADKEPDSRNRVRGTSSTALLEWEEKSYAKSHGLLVSLGFDITAFTPVTYQPHSL